MRFEKYSPSPALQGVVEYYYVLEHDGIAALPLQLEIPPNCCMALVLTYGDRIEQLHSQGESVRLPQFFLAGTATGCCTLRLGGRHEVVGAVIRASSATKILDTSSAEVLNRRVPLDLVVPRESDILVQRVAELEPRSLKVTALERFLQERVHTTSYRTDVIDSALDAILQENGLVKPDQLSDVFCMSPRQLRRRFKDRLGVGPKLAASIKRFGYVNLLISQRPQMDWQDVIYLAGFYDQAHFIKDFRKFAGVSPSTRAAVPLNTPEPAPSP